MGTNRNPNVRKIAKMSGGKSYGLTLPIAVVRDLKWKERQKVVVEYDKKRKRIIIKDWQKTRK